MVFLVLVSFHKQVCMFEQPDHLILQMMFITNTCTLQGCRTFAGSLLSEWLHSDGSSGYPPAMRKLAKRGFRTSQGLGDCLNTAASLGVRHLLDSARRTSKTDFDRILQQKTSKRLGKLPSRFWTNDAAAAEMLLPEVKRSQQKLKRLLQVSSEKNQGHLAFAALEAIRHEGTMKLMASNYVLGMSSCSKSKLWQEALHLFNVMPEANVQHNVISYSAAISACEKGEQSQQALSFFRKMVQKKVEPNVITYNAIISATGKVSDWQKSLSFFEKIHTSNAQPSIISYNAAISACEKSGQWQRALTILEGMMKSQFHPDDLSFNATISACKRGLEDECVDFFWLKVK